MMGASGETFELSEAPRFRLERGSAHSYLLAPQSLALTNTRYLALGMSEESAESCVLDLVGDYLAALLFEHEHFVVIYAPYFVRCRALVGSE
jgi:hypothetical protein